MARALLSIGFVLAVTCLPSFFVSEAISQSNEDCLTCHSKEGGAPPVDLSLLERSVHGTVECVSCHSETSVLPHHEKMERVDCGGCHGDILAIFQKSAHGLALDFGIREAPYCTDCHGNHLILSHTDRASSVHPASIRNTCGSCHEAERINNQYGLANDAVKTYDQSYHGLAARYGSTKVANCASCHGYHDILASSDPASSVSKVNLSATCRKCHPGAGSKLASGYVHSNPLRSKNNIVRYVIIFYVLFICLVIGGMLLHNLVDFIKKLAGHFRAVKTRAIELRFVFSERFQHIALAVTFGVLAYSGFARRFPDAWWFSPFRLFDNPANTRGIIHRVAAGIFIALCIYHIWFILLTRRGRDQLNELKPGLVDFRDFFSAAKYNAGISKEPPQFGRYNYIEKSEYWALVWGSVIMIITGLALVFVNLTLKHFPLWVAELVTSIHFYEAVLATLAIPVWHFYWTILDPHVYPMNWSWITGRTAEKRLEKPVPAKRRKKPRPRSSQHTDAPQQAGPQQETEGPRQTEPPQGAEGTQALHGKGSQGVEKRELADGSPNTDGPHHTEGPQGAEGRG